MSQKTLNLCLERYNFVKFGETTKSSHTVLCINNAYSVNSDKYRLTPTAIASKHGDGYVFTLNYDFDRPLFTIVQKSYTLDGTSGNIVFEGIDPISKGGSKYLRKVTVSPVKLSDGSYLLEVTNDEYLRIGTTGAALGDEELESLNEKIVATGGIEKSVETVGGKQVLKLDASGSAGAKEIVYFDVNPSDPPSGIYEAIGEALSNNKIPVIKIDDAVYFYTATGTDKYVFVGGYTKKAVGYTEIEVSDDDSVASKSVDDKVFNMFLLYKTDPASPGDPPGDEDSWVCDANKHVITKDELVAAHADCRYFILNNDVEPDSNSRKYFAAVTNVSNSYVQLRFYMVEYSGEGAANFYQKTVSNDSEGRLYISDSYQTYLAGTSQAVLVSEPQSFDATQKAQGRDNIGAASASDMTALQSQVSSLSDVSAYSVKGEATVAQLNAGPSGIQAGWAYQLTDSGTLTDGTLAVVAGDTVAWDGTKWFPLVKSDYYATKTYAQNVAHSIAPEFDPTRNYVVDESCTYGGTVYIFTSDHPAGEWNPAHATISGQSALLRLTALNVFKRSTTGITDLNDLNETGYYRVDKTMANYPSGAGNGLLVVFSAGESRKVQLLESSVATSSRLSRLFYRVGEFAHNTWGAWEEVGSASQSLMRFELNASANLNDCVNNGYYCLSNSWTWTNKPTGFSYGFMLVFTQSAKTFQLIADQANNKVYFRNLISGTWTNWTEFADNAYVQSAINALNTRVFNIITFPNKLLSFTDLPNVQSLPNTNFEPETSSARLVAYDLGTYNSFYFYAQSNVEVYFDDDVIENANYLSVAYGTNPSGTWVPVPETVTNKRYMQCSVVDRKRKNDNNLPTSNAKLTIPAGSIIVFTQRNTDSAKVNINCYPQLSPSLPTPEPTPSPEEKKMEIKYISSNTYKISFGDYDCELRRTVSEAADVDNWNVVHISHNGSDIIGQWTDIIGPLKLAGDGDFIGGVHGSETTDSLYVYAGSKKLTLDSLLDEEFETLTIMMTSTCRRESDKSNAFRRRVCVEISRNKMHLSSEFVCIASSAITVTRVTNGGLISADNHVILGCYMNNYSCDNYPLTAPNNKSKYNTHAVIVTTLGTIVVNNIKGHEQEDYRGYFNLFDTETVPRTKVYFDVYNGTGKSVSAGDAFYGECEYIFEP